MVKHQTVTRRRGERKPLADPWNSKQDGNHRLDHWRNVEIRPGSEKTVETFRKEVISAEILPFNNPHNLRKSILISGTC